MKHILLPIFKCSLQLLIALLILACSDAKRGEVPPLAAEINGNNITIAELDGIIQSQLYESLYGIYYKRKIALTELLADKALNLEVQARGITKVALLKLEVDDKQTLEGLKKFIKDNQLDLGIPNSENPLQSYEINTKEGDQVVRELYRQKLYEDFIVSLQDKYNLKIFLTPPLSPRVDLEGMIGYSRGRSDATVHVMIATNFECESCRHFTPMFDRLYAKYKDRVQFTYLPFSPNVNLSQVISECAAEQGKFWEVHDLLMKQTQQDTTGYLTLVHSIGIDTVMMRSRLENSADIHHRLNNVSSRLMKSGIKLTPTLIINSRVFYGQFDQDKIEEYINMEIKRSIKERS